MKIESGNSVIHFTDNIITELFQILSGYRHENVFVLVDENTRKYCLPVFSGTPLCQSSKVIEIKSGEENKSLETLSGIWSFLSENGADRGSLLINLGGGVICDVGGFAAATYKRGINFINLPTSLLAQVDASTGGKLGINFRNLKNEIGLFLEPCHVFIYPAFLKTLDKQNILSGFAEMIKHALISGKDYYNSLLQFNHNQLENGFLMKLIYESVKIKSHFVTTDFREKNLRKALNFGHTLGHAFESLSIRHGRPIPHGIAVAHGMLGELYLSCKILGFDQKKSDQICSFIVSKFNKPEVAMGDYNLITEYIKHDKKNTGTPANFTLLSDTGKVITDNYPTERNIFEALEFINSL